MKRDLFAVDLFCGIGGLTHGLQLAGIRVVAGIDNDGSCQYAYEKNNDSKFLNKKIEDLTGKELDRLYPKNSLAICAYANSISIISLNSISRFAVNINRITHIG